MRLPLGFALVQCQRRQILAYKAGDAHALNFAEERNDHRGDACLAVPLRVLKGIDEVAQDILLPLGRNLQKERLLAVKKLVK